MSQSPGSTAANGTTEYSSALEEYHAKAASGYFKPATTNALPPLSLANARLPFVPPPQIPQQPAYQANSPALPATTTAMPGAIASQAASYPSYGHLASTSIPTASATTTASPSITYSPYGSLPSTPTPRVTFSGHQPNLFPHHNQIQSYSPFPAYQPPQLQPQHDLFVPTPDSITFEHISARLQCLLNNILTNWVPHQVVLLSTALTDHIIAIGKKGELGLDGLGSVDDIFMAVGHEGTWEYMALAVVAPIAVKVLLRGPSYFLDGRNPLVDGPSMEILRSGFNTVAGQEWSRASDMIRRVERR